MRVRGRSGPATVLAVVVAGVATLCAACSAGAPHAAVRSASHAAARSVSASYPAPADSARPPARPALRRAPGSDRGGFVAAGLSLVDPTHGWAVGTMRCTHGAGRCTALLVAADRRHWNVEPVSGRSPFGVPTARCGTRCVTGVTFVSRRVGYVYGRSALYLTTDGGAHWQRQPGGAFELLATPTTVVRVAAADGQDCLPGCRYRLDWASVNAPAFWHRSRLPARPEAFWTSLVGFGDYVYFVSYGNPVGGGTGRAKLFSSADRGRTWTIRRYHPAASQEAPPAVGEPCPQVDGEVDGAAIALTAQGTVMVRCVPRPTTGRSRPAFVITSTDHAAGFVRRRSSVPGWEFATGGGGRSAAEPHYLTSSSFGWRLRRHGYAVTGDGGRTWDNRGFVLVPPPPRPADCAARALRVRGGRQGAPFRTAAGQLEFTNTGPAACRLHGLPKIVIESASGVPLPIRRWPVPAHATRTVELAPRGGTVQVALTWTNWCGPPPGALRVQITLPGTGGRLSAPFDGPPAYDGVPGCVAPGKPSVVRLGGYTRRH